MTILKELLKKFNQDFHSVMTKFYDDSMVEILGSLRWQFHY